MDQQQQQQQQKKLHMVFFPMMAQGHMLPILDMGKLFSSRSSVKSIIITTPLNSFVFSNSTRSSKHSIHLQILDFPTAARIPYGIENLDQCSSTEMATTLLQDPVDRLLGELRPDCLVADMFFPWATASAAKFNVPRLVFLGTSFFAMSAGKTITKYKPFKYVESDSEPFVLPNLPQEIKLIRSQVSPLERDEIVNDFTEFMNQVKNCDLNCYGILVNSFLELEPDYVHHFRNVWKRKVRHIGPLSLCHREIEDKVVRGKKAAIDEDKCLKWLDSIPDTNSVIYVCFGSEANFSASQLYEVAVGLEASSQRFIWVVRRRKNEEENAWLPDGFDERTKEKGLIIQGWAPQIMILDHEAVGGFVTDCGWNSTMEAMCAGVPMVTWPGGASGEIKSEAVEKAVKTMMVEEEGKKMRRRVKELKEKAKLAIEEGGSSYNGLSALLEELCSLKLRM
ncbi:hypothetical protein LguiA_008828 [Lonicera macranthoides]